MHAFFTGDDCFLARKEWRNVWDTGARTPYEKLVEEFWYYLALCPRVLKHARALRKKNHSPQGATQEEIDAVIRQTSELRDRLIRWFTTTTRYIPLPTEVPSEDPSFPTPTMYLFVSEWAGTLFIGYWSSLLLLQHVLAEWQETDFPETDEQLLENIFKSFEHTGKGFMGPYRVGYAVCMASEFADAERKVWIHQYLWERARQFAAVTPEMKPELMAVNMHGSPDYLDDGVDKSYVIPSRVPTRS